MKPITRRNFVKTSMAAGIAMALPHSRVRGANDDIGVAVAGLNGRGRGLAGGFHESAGVRVVALCDVDKKVLEREAKRYKDRGEKVKTYVDCRRMVEDEAVDIVAIATPDHWHVPLAAFSVVAGTDVYVESGPQTQQDGSAWHTVTQFRRSDGCDGVLAVRQTRKNPNGQGDQ